MMSALPPGQVFNAQYREHSEEGGGRGGGGR